MKAKLIDSTNKMLLNSYGGIDGNFSVNGNINWLYSFSSAFSTSHVIDYEMLEDDVVKLNTLNNTYTFKLNNCEFDSSGITEIDSLIIEEHNAMKSEKSLRWKCQLDGGFLSGVLSTVTLPEPMTKDEAQDYILKNKIKDDKENTYVSVLLEAIKE